MNCTFCNAKCAEHSGGQIQKYYYCTSHEKCIVKYLFGEEGWSTIVIGFKYKDNYFHACFFNDNPFMPEKFRIDKVLNAYTSYQSAIPVITLNFQPDHIVPENVAEKLSKYLVML